MSPRLFLALFVPCVAHAQASGVERYFPLEVGNRWVWSADDSDAPLRYYRTAVVGDTLIGGEPYAVVEAEELLQLYLPVASARCALRLVPDGGSGGSDYEIEEVRVSGTAACLAPSVTNPEDFGPDLHDHPGSPDWVEIGGITYAFDEVITIGHGNWPYTDGEGRFASGAGPLGGWYNYDTGYQTSALVYAEVGGETYGVEPQPAPVPDPARFYPLGLGDTWVYEGSEEPDGWEVREVRTVVGDTTLDGAAYALVAREWLDSSDGSLIEEALCAVRYVDGWFEWEAVSGRCEPTEETFQLAGWWAPLTDSAYVQPSCTVLGVYEMPYCFDIEHYGDIDVPVYDHVQFVADLGFVSYLTDPGHLHMSLAYARVAGVEYGVNPVANEPAVVPESFILEPAAPNPFRAAAALTLVLPSAEAVTVEAFDALGRRVLASDLGALAPGRHRVELDGSAWALGVYVVRVTTAEGEAATRRVVRTQ